MSDNGRGTGNEPQPGTEQHFFGQGDGFGRPPHQSPYGSGSNDGTGYQGANSFAGDAEPRTRFDRSAAGYPPPTGQPATGHATAPGSAGGPPPTAGAMPIDRPGPKRRGRAGLMVLSLALAALVGGGVGVGSYAALGRDGQTASSSPINVTTQEAPQQAKTDGTIEGAAKVIEPSVVTITVQAGSSGDIGSGVVLDKSGHILTNNHVVSSARSNTGGFPGGQQGGQAKITVTFSNGKTARATVVGADETEDLAVLKVDGVQDLKPAKFAKSGSLSVGQSVVAVGAPLGLSQSVTSGIVSNASRPVRSGNNNDAVYMAVQTDAAINPGNSGGPLVDLDGAVVGIDSSIASTGDSGSGGESGNIGIGFAIPADVGVRVASELIADGHSDDAVLGVTISGTDGSSLGSTTTGVQLRSVQSDGAAAAAGLKSGDVVTALNGFKVTTSDGLIAATHYYAPGTSVKLSYQRGGQSKTTEAKLGKA